MNNPASSLPSVTVIICTRDRPDCLDRCLAALAVVDYPKFDVLVVDNAPSDSRTRDVAARWNTRYLVESRPGHCRARNAGIRGSAAEVLAFLDDDSVPEPTWLRALAAAFTDPSVHAVTGRNILPVSRVTVDSAFDTDMGPERRRFDKNDSLWFEKANFGGIGTGSNMAFHRRALDAWRGFDERLGRGTPMHGSDENHAFYSLISTGATIVYLPEARVAHPCREQLGDPETCYLKDRSAAVAYMVFLFFETPYKSRVLGYLLTAATGASRPWRYAPHESRRRGTSFGRTLRASFSGLRLYWVAARQMTQS